MALFASYKNEALRSHFETDLQYSLNYYRNQYQLSVTLFPSQIMESLFSLISSYIIILLIKANKNQQL
jgi:prolipoprotein diacylglyceryltransferase